MLKRWMGLLVCVWGLTVQAEAATATPYRLGAGDVIRISVYDHPDLLLEAEIASDGSLNMPLISSVKLGGLTFNEAQTLIARRLEQGGFVKSAHVNILISEYRSQRIAVLGEVTRPGRYALDGDGSLLTLLAHAGGISPYGGDLVYLVRQGQQQSVYLPDLRRPGNSLATIKVQPGDQLYVPRFQQIYVYGEVMRPGAYRLEPGMTVMQALALAGGFNGKADKSDIERQRRQGDGAIDKQGVQLADSLQADDVVYVNESLF
jgi:polysaccharide export outer membrane protein